LSYFENVKVGEEVFGLIFGLGVVKEVFDTGHYRCMVEFNNDYEIPYSKNGISGWGKFKEQTLFYKTDIDITDFDFSPISKVLTLEKILYLKQNNKLEIRLPSGLWHVCDKTIKKYVDKSLEKEKYHLFRKSK
jgi:hypothetical protein